MEVRVKNSLSPSFFQLSIMILSHRLHLFSSVTMGWQSWRPPGVRRLCLVPGDYVKFRAQIVPTIV